MNPLRCSRHRWLHVSLLTFGLLALLAFPSWSDEKPAAAAAAKAQDQPNGLLGSEWTRNLTWRSIGPANMAGRIVAISVFEADPSTYWIATASGGLLKTVNNGITYEHQFDKEATVSIGDVCVAPSNRDIVWVGTGENNPRNSVSYGDGVYKSTDGGKTWKNMGLKKSFQVGRILVHPKDPDVVYVGALGRLYGPNEERGLFKTTNGGETWDKVLYVDDKTGIIEMRMHPSEPDTLLVATWERERDGFDTNDPSKRWGSGGGLYKTTDGGKNFKKVTKGLPTNKLGRVGLDYYRKDPNVVFAIIDCEKIGMGPAGVAVGGNAYMGIQGEDADNKGARLTVVTPGGPADKAQLQPGDVITAVGAKAVRTYDELTDRIREHSAGDKVKIKFLRDNEAKEMEVTLEQRPAGGRPGGGADPNRPFGANLGGQRENVQDRQGQDGHEYGGVYKSTDGGESWTRINSVNPRPMYFSKIRVDPSDDKYIYILGVALYRSNDGGRTFRADVRGIHADQHALWIDSRDGRHMIVGTDGGHYQTYDRMANWDHHNQAAIGQFYHVALDTRRNYKVYGGLQDNGSWGGPTATRNQTGPINEDWISVGGGDGFTCRVDPNDPDQIYYTSQNGGLGRRHLKTGESASIRPRTQQGQGQQYRFNWNTPFYLSHHNSKIYYCAGNYVFRSLDRGNNLQAISPEITATRRGSATAFSESPRNPNVLYVGTDDGYFWVTRDGGKEWTNITNNVGLPGLRWVTTIEASRFEEGRAYVVFDGHRSNDDDPHVFVTEDFGKTWQSLRANLPWGSTRCLSEDIQNANLLYLGTEFGASFSLDRGKSWNKLGNLPTVAVHEFAIHPTAGEIVAATHGRSLWVLDVSALRQLKLDSLTGKAQLYKPTSAIRWASEPSRGRTNRRFVGQNPSTGAQIYYSLPQKAQQIALKIMDIEGNTIRDLRVSSDAGLHRVTWDLTRPAARQPMQPGGRPGTGGLGGRPVAPGTYRVVLSVDGQDFSAALAVEPDPTAPPGLLAENEEEEEEEMEEVIIDD